jgi:hypothetical protein
MSLGWPPLPNFIKISQLVQRLKWGETDRHIPTQHDDLISLFTSLRKYNRLLKLGSPDNLRYSDDHKRNCTIPSIH